MSENPKYSFGTAKQLLFEYAMELIQHSEGKTDSEIGSKILSIINELDKMEESNEFNN